MGTEQKQAEVTKRPKLGRPRQMREEARSNRELENLEQIAYDEDRSLSAVVHQIVARHLENLRRSGNKE